MIVCACHNGIDHLPRFIQGVEQFGTDGHELVIVNTHSTDSNILSYFEDLKNKGYTVIDCIPGCGYESGAIVTALRKFTSEKLMFVHDSCYPISKDWVNEFEFRLTPHTPIVCWDKFQPCLFACGQEHLDYISEVCGEYTPPDSGIFGSIFIAYSYVLHDLDNKGYFSNLPQNKIQSEAWERIWAILFHKEGYQVGHIIPYLDFHQMFNTCLYLRKTLVHRL